MSDAVKKFWEEWLDADELDRHDIIERLLKTGLREFLKKEVLENEVFSKSFALFMNSYFQDFYEVIADHIDKSRMHPAQLGTSVKKK